MVLLLFLLVSLIYVKGAPGKPIDVPSISSVLDDTSDKVPRLKTDILLAVANAKPIYFVGGNVRNPI